MANKIKVSITFIISVIVILLGIGIGSTFINPLEVLNVLGHKLFGCELSENISSADVSIVWNFRTIRTLMAFVVGAALSVSGSAMQSVLQNPLASSYTLGVSAGSSLAAGIIIVFAINFLGIFTIPLIGIIFGILTVILTVAIATKFDRNMQNHTIVLVGMVLSLFLNAIITLLNILNRESMQQMIFWQMGSFAGKQMIELGLVATFTIPAIIIMMTKTRELDILTFGETQAHSMGVDVKKSKWSILILASALTGCAVSFVGIIGFVDLIAPHVVRRFFGSKHSIVIPMSALFGGVFMVIADIISRIVLQASDLPIGAVTALAGAPFFMYVFFKRKKGV